MRRMGRTDLLERYRALPLPSTTDEPWRFTDLKGFDPDTFVSNGHVPGPGPATRPAATMLELDVAAFATVTEDGIEIERAPDGITFEPLRDHELLGTLVGADEKFAAHNAALWEHGLLVQVPKGLVLEQPLYVRISNSREGGALFWRLLVVAEPESRFSVVEEYASAAAELGGYSNAVSELFVGQGAKVEYVSLQNLSAETWHFASHRARVDRDAELDWVAGGFGSKKGKTRIQNDLAGPGATSRVTGAYFADGEQHLEEQAHADSIPGLEIEANDVRCTHGATISPVNRDELFYAMARGISRGEAERLIVRGFFTDVLNRIELEPVREAVTEALEARIPQA
ncbi:MAG: SufD family Fe-S cluster assembly protein [Actinobacteria bacterium]|nr:MAG: SufD family Fe-S cluster assembly protein [Actinomycetota bacterium]